MPSRGLPLSIKPLRHWIIIIMGWFVYIHFTSSESEAVIQSVVITTLSSPGRGMILESNKFNEHKQQKRALIVWNVKKLIQRLS